jgi:hypothetical protein
MKESSNVAHVGEKTDAARVFVRKSEEINNLEDSGLHWRIILKGILKMGLLGVHCIFLAQDKLKWRAVVNTVTKLLVP